jgi:mannosyltransferase
MGLSGLAYALRVAGLDFQSLWRDEVDAIRFAGRPLGEVLRTFVTPGQNGPLYHLLLHPWLGLAGRSEFALRFFSVLFGVLAVPATYRLARRLLPRIPSAGLVAALLVATSPYLVWYSQEGKMYTLVVALVLLSMERYLAAIEEGGWHRWLTYVLLTGLACYVHLVAALIIPAQAILFLVLRRRGRDTAWLPWLASMAALSLPYLPLLLWQLPLLLEPANTGYRFVPLHEMLYSLLANYSLGVVQGTTLWTLALFGGLLLAAGWLWGRRESARASLGVLLCWLWVPVLGFFLTTLIRPLYTARYLIFVLPAYLLLLAAGLVAIARRSRMLSALLLVALLATNGWGVWLQARTPLKADFRATTDYVQRRLAPDDLILFQIPYGRHSFDYYYRREAVSEPGEGQHRIFLPRLAGGGGEPYRWAAGLYTNAGMQAGEVDRLMDEITAGSQVLWLVATEVPLWDERDLVATWLADHATPTDEARFVRVTVRRYHLP